LLKFVGEALIIAKVELIFRSDKK